MTVLRIDDVGYRIDGNAVLDGISLCCESGQFVALLGPNGAGKSTLMRILSGLSRPSSGRVLIDDVPVQSIGPRKLATRRAYVPQNARAEWPVSVERLVALGLMPQLPVFGDLDPEAWRRVDEALASCDLGHKKGQSVTTLSGGELARAMIARALVGQPEILMADEPLAGLDPRHALEGAMRLAALARAGRLVIASMHDLTLAARYATHVLILRKGGMAAYGPTHSTFTSDCLSDVFDIRACVHDTGTGNVIVDFIASD